MRPYQANFTKAKVKEYVSDLDDYLMMKGKLVTNFKWERYLVHLNDDDSLQFEEMYEAL